VQTNLHFGYLDL